MSAASVATADVSRQAILTERFPKLLSEFGFFADLNAQTPNDGVVKYEINAPLFTDHAEKARYIHTPAAVPFTSEGVLPFPTGSALIKTFGYGDRKVETRVLLHREEGWIGLPYVWNHEGTDAELKIAGKNLNIETEYGLINYRVPNVNQCKGCHVDAQKNLVPIGPKIRNLNGGDQLQRLVAAGILSGVEAELPVTPDYRDEALPIDVRARAYLDANCGHCHAPGLPADTSGLYLHWEEDRPIHLGINKTPVAAGRGSGNLKYDIVPGDADQSILIYRMVSEDPGVMMPEIGRSVIDAYGVALLRDYINAMD